MPVFMHDVWTNRGEFKHDLEAAEYFRLSPSLVCKWKKNNTCIEAEVLAFVLNRPCRLSCVCVEAGGGCLLFS